MVLTTLCRFCRYRRRRFSRCYRRRRCHRLHCSRRRRYRRCCHCCSQPLTSSLPSSSLSTLSSSSLQSEFDKRLTTSGFFFCKNFIFDPKPISNFVFFASSLKTFIFPPRLNMHFLQFFCKDPSICCHGIKFLKCPRCIT